MTNDAVKTGNALKHSTIQFSDQFALRVELAQARQTVRGPKLTLQGIIIPLQAGEPIGHDEPDPANATDPTDADPKPRKRRR